MGWDDRIICFLSFLVTGTVVFEPLGFVATVVLSFVLGLVGFLVGGRTTAYKARRGL